MIFRLYNFNIFNIKTCINLFTTFTINNYFNSLTYRFGS